MTDGDAMAPSHSVATNLRARWRQAAALGWVVSAAFAGAVVGWLATAMMVPAAPIVPPFEDAAIAFDDAAPAVVPAIVVEALAPPDRPVVARILAGPAHAPAELALLYFRFASDADNAPPMRDVLPGRPHGGADVTLLLLAHNATDGTDETDEAASTVAAVLPGAPHRPAELFPMLSARMAELEASLSRSAPVLRSLPGAPHTMPELTLLMARFQSLEAPRASRPMPAPRDPGRFVHALPEIVTVARQPHPGPPHTMPEVMLLFAALERERAIADATIALHATWWLADGGSNAAPPALAPLPGERPAAPAVDVAITETGPERHTELADNALLQPSGTPMIAIMIDDLGLNAARARRTADLPGPITMAFMPYGEGLDAQVEEAAGQGHEIFLHLPMEPTDPSIDPGPHALLESLTTDQLETELAWNLDRFGGYVGVNNHMGSLLTQDADAMAIVMAELHRRGLLFVDSVTAAGSVAYDVARANGIPSARRDVFLDNVPERDAVLAQLDLLEALARKQGFAIGIGHPHDSTLAALGEWLPGALARGVLLVPASRIIASRDVIVAQHADQ